MAQSTAAASPAPELAGASVAHLTLQPVPASARAAREFARRHVGADSPTVETVLLLTSELVTNAVLHARTPLDLTLQVNEESVLIAVADDDGRRPEQKPASTERLDGRGIALVAALSRDWGSDVHPGGKTVWCLLDVAS